MREITKIIIFWLIFLIIAEIGFYWFNSTGDWDILIHLDMIIIVALIMCCFVFIERIKNLEKMIKEAGK